MLIKAKFRCNTVTDNGNQKTATLHAVTSGSEENKSFAKYTPGGQLTITVDNETPAAGFFKPQTDYYLTFEDATPVLEPVAADRIAEGHEAAVR